MRFGFFVCIFLFLFHSAFAANPDAKLRVHLTLRDGSSEDYKLDWVDEQKIVVFEKER